MECSARRRSRDGLLLAAALVVAAVAGVGALASCEVGDAICTDHTVEEDRNDQCPYGPPGGPQHEKADGCQVIFDKTGCDVTFRGDVYPILVKPIGAAPAGGGCTTAACHGPTGTGSVAMIVDANATADQLYQAMAARKNEGGDPYIGKDDANAYMFCNVTATIGGGSAMPPNAGLTDPASLEIVKKWITCGMELDGTIGAGGGGDGGGNDGGGDVGGAGVGGAGMGGAGIGGAGGGM